MRHPDSRSNAALHLQHRPQATARGRARAQPETETENRTKAGAGQAESWHTMVQSDSTRHKATESKKKKGHPPTFKTHLSQFVSGGGDALIKGQLFRGHQTPGHPDIRQTAFFLSVFFYIDL